MVQLLGMFSQVVTTVILVVISVIEVYLTDNGHLTIVTKLLSVEMSALEALMPVCTKVTVVVMKYMSIKAVLQAHSQPLGVVAVSTIVLVIWLVVLHTQSFQAAADQETETRPVQVVLVVGVPVDLSK